MEELMDRERRLAAEVEEQRGYLLKTQDDDAMAHRAIILASYERDLQEVRDMIMERWKAS